MHKQSTINLFSSHGSQVGYECLAFSVSRRISKTKNTVKNVFCNISVKTKSVTYLSFLGNFIPKSSWINHLSWASISKEEAAGSQVKNSQKNENLWMHCDTQLLPPWKSFYGSAQTPLVCLHARRVIDNAHQYRTPDTSGIKSLQFWRYCASGT